MKELLYHCQIYKITKLQDNQNTLKKKSILGISKACKNPNGGVTMQTFLSWIY
jgi:hypothetical protein